MNDDYDVVKTERRVYDDVVTMSVDRDGMATTSPWCKPGKR
jgi:hypothetical protein